MSYFLIQKFYDFQFVKICKNRSSRDIPGEGTVDWDSIFSGLAAINFSGDMVLESFMVIHPDIARALAVWQPVASSSEAVVEQGFKYIREVVNRHGFSV